MASLYKSNDTAKFKPDVGWSGRLCQLGRGEDGAMKGIPTSSRNKILSGKSNINLRGRSTGYAWLLRDGKIFSGIEDRDTGNPVRKEWLILQQERRSPGIFRPGTGKKNSACDWRQLWRTTINEAFKSISGFSSMKISRSFGKRER